MNYLSTWLAKLEAWIICAVLLGLLGLAVAQVAWRNLVQPHFHMQPLLWIDEILRHGTFVLGLLGASFATSTDKLSTSPGCAAQ